MNKLISINTKFMGLNPTDLINIIKENSKYTDGIEIAINDYYKEKDYINNLAYICKKNNYIFQIHGNSNYPKEEQVKILKEIETLSDYLDYKIHVVLHPITCNTVEESKQITYEYMNYITDNIDNDKIIISLENLENYNNYENLRLTIDDIHDIVANNENIYLTYDIGHEIVQYGKVIDIKDYLIPLITNIHLHTNNNNYSDGFDHKPIYENDHNWNIIIKSILFLKHINYDQSIVFEYDLNACEGNSIEEKIISYCKSIDIISERI